jgi:hypothetical protein
MRHEYLLLSHLRWLYLQCAGEKKPGRGKPGRASLLTAPFSRTVFSGTPVDCLAAAHRVLPLLVGSSGTVAEVPELTISVDERHAVDLGITGTRVTSTVSRPLLAGITEVHIDTGSR